MYSIIEKENYQRILNRYFVDDKIDIGRVHVLIEMVKNGDYPDNGFNGDEILIWNAIADVVDYYERELREFYESATDEDSV